MRSGWSFELKLVPVLIVLFAIGCVSAETLIHTQATGYAAIVGGDQSSAFTEAKRAALREAVEEGVGVLLSSQTRVENFAVLQDDILTSTEGYVRSFDIIEQGPADSQTYVVTLDAVVELGQLHQRLDALDLLIESADNPYILCLGVARSAFSTDSNIYLATALREALALTSGRFNLMAAPEGNTSSNIEEAARFGLAQGADIVVRGEAKISEISGNNVPFAQASLVGLGLHSALAELRVEAVWTDTGELFSVATRSSRAAAATREGAAEKALRQGIAVLADSLVGDLVENWREKVYSGRLVRLVVEMQSADLKPFASAFSLAVGGVEKVYRRSYEQGIAIFDVRSKKTGFDIARHLSSKGLGEYDIDIQRVTPNSLKLQIVSGL